MFWALQPVVPSAGGADSEASGQLGGRGRQGQRHPRRGPKAPLAPPDPQRRPNAHRDRRQRTARTRPRRTGRPDRAGISGWRKPRTVSRRKPPGVKGNRKHHRTPGLSPTSHSPKQLAGEFRDPPIGPAGTPCRPQPTPLTHRTTTRIPTGSKRPRPPETHRLHPQHQWRQVLRSPQEKRRRRCLRSRHARERLLLRRGCGNPHAGAARPSVNRRRRTLAKRPQTHNLGPRHSVPHPRRRQAMRNPLRRPPPERRLPMHRHRTPANGSEILGTTARPNRTAFRAMARGSRKAQGAVRIPASNQRPNTLFLTERALDGLSAYALRQTPKGATVFASSAGATPNLPKLIEASHTGPDPLRLRRRHRRQSERRCPRQTRSKGPTMPTRRHSRPARNHP